MRPRHRLRRAVAFAVDAVVLPLCVLSLMGPFEQALAGIVAAALVVWLVHAFRAEEAAHYWGAIVVNLIYFGLFLPLLPVLGVLLVVATTLVVLSGHSPGTFMTVLTVSTQEGEPATRLVATQRSILAMVQASVIAGAVVFASVSVSTVLRDSVGAGAGLVVVLAAVVGGQFVRRSMVDVMSGTHLVNIRVEPLRPIPLNPYASALWGSTVGLDLDLAPPEPEPEAPDDP